MRKGIFRPCIDIHDGRVKQIVGGDLTDRGSVDNFVSDKNAAFYANLYRENNLRGGHIILLNKAGTPEYEADKREALEALRTFPGGMSVGGGITPENAQEFLDAGASHVIVTSYVFSDGKVEYEKIYNIIHKISSSRLILDLSAKRKGNDYFIATDRWQKTTNVKLSEASLTELSGYCDEILVHAIDAEGKKGGIDESLAEMLSVSSELNNFTVTYAGGVKDMENAFYLSVIGLDFTVGSALDIFGGKLSFDELAKRFGQA